MDDLIQFEIAALGRDHLRDDFDCGKQPLNDYLRLHALKNQTLGYGRTYVAMRQGSRLVEGFYTVSMSSVRFDHLPDALSTRVPKYPMPVAHLGKLAIRKECQRKGLGKLLLIDAFRRVLTASDLVAARALDAITLDDDAKQWYLRYGFLAFKDNPQHLYLPMDTIRKIVVGL